MMVRRVTERFRSLVLRNRKRITASEKLARSIAETLEGRRLMAGDGAGLVANYYSDGNFTNLAAARTDSTVDFNWGTRSPAAGVEEE
jgi:hypothetical protein